MAIKVILRAHREALEMLDREGYVVEPVRFSKGDHLIIRVTKDGRSGQLTIAGSPRGNVLDVIKKYAKRATS